MKIKHYSFTVKEGEDDLMRLHDETGEVHVFSMPHKAFVRFAQNMNKISFDSTNRLDFLKEEGREN